MPLKLTKVEKLLLDNKLLITSFYLLGDNCLFLKVFSIDTGHSFLVRIDEEYELIIRRENIIERPNISIMSLVPVSSDESNIDSALERYGKIPDDRELKEKYDINFQKDFGTEEIEANLESNYKKRIYLNSLDKTNKHRIKECTRQLKRLNLSFDDLRYTLGLVENNVFLYTEEDSIQQFIIKEQNTEGNRLIFVIVKLDFFFEDKETIVNDIITIKKSLFSILDKNAETNLGKLLALLQKFDTAGETLRKFNTIKGKLSSYLQHFETLLQNICKKEKDITNEIYDLEETHEKGSINEVTFVHAKRGLEEKKEKTINIKQKILKNINTILNRCDNIYLKCDKVEFDNAVLIDTIQRNIKEMEEEIEKNVEF